MRHSLFTIHHSPFATILFIIILLMPGSKVAAQQVSGAAETIQPFYTIEGGVSKPGRFPLAKNFRVKNAILAAGGLTKDADRKRAEIIRFNKRQKVYYTIYFQVESALSGDPTDNFVLLDKDRIIIHSVREKVDEQRAEPKAEPQKVKQASVFIAGEIAKPGAYHYQEGMTVVDLVSKSGSTLETSYPEQAEILSTVSGSGKSSGEERKIINLKKAMEDDPAHNVPLRPNDRLVVQSIPDGDKAMPAVCLTGGVVLSGKYPITKGERLFSVIERAGGYTRDAYPRAAVFVRERVRKLQQSSLEEMAARIERELASGNFAADGKSKSTGNAAEKNTDTEVKMKLLLQIKTLRANGRIKVVVTGVDMQKERVSRVPDIELEDGDSLHIPSLSDAVRVTGAVNSEKSFHHNGQSDYRDYIEAAGGYTPTAEESDAFVIKVDGSTQHVGKAFVEWSKKRSRLEIGGSRYSNKIIEPGDVIVIPERFSRCARLQEIYVLTRTLINNGIVAPYELIVSSE